MRLVELEGWLLKMGWRPEPNKPGSHRAWTHPRFPGERISYAETGRTLRPDVVLALYEKLRKMQMAFDSPKHDEPVICGAEKSLASSQRD